MALHVSPEILEQYHGFYSLALDGTTDDGCALVLENVPAAGLRAALEAVPEPDALRTVLIKKLSGAAEPFLPRKFSGAGMGVCAPLPGGGRAVGYRAHARAAGPCCDGLQKAAGHQRAGRRGGAGAPVFAVQRLEHRKAGEPCAPAGLCALRTLDLGCRGAKDKVKLDFNMLYPQLDSLTITPSLKEYFITNTEAGR